MKKILIINQHKGTVEELRNYLKNYIEVVDDTYFDQILLLNNLTDYDNSKFMSNEAPTYCNKSNRIEYVGSIGLSQSRRASIELIKSKILTSNYSHVLFGCTNSSYLKLGKSQYNGIARYTGFPILVPCIYEHDPFDRDNSQLSKSYVTFDEWFNNDKNPDYTLVFPSRLLLKNIYFMTVDREKYTPEDILLFNCTRTFNKLKIYNPRGEGYFIKAWYNPNGMSMTFNRQSILDNKGGFYLRARILLTAYCNGKLSLTYDKLKWLIYDYVTLAPINKYNLFKGTIIEPMIQWAVFHWIKDPNHKHQISFMEDSKDGD